MSHTADLLLLLAETIDGLAAVSAGTAVAFVQHLELFGLADANVHHADLPVFFDALAQRLSDPGVAAYCGNAASSYRRVTGR